jgi:ribosomal protein L10
MVQKKKTRAESRRKKYALWTKLWDCVDKFKKVIVVQCSNITANVFHDLRKALRPLRAVILMGKNVGTTPHP